MIEQRTVLCTTTDPDFAEAIAQSTQSLSGRLLWATGLAEWVEGLDRLFPMVALIDIDRFDTDQPKPTLGHHGHPAVTKATSSISPVQQSPAEPWDTVLRRIKLRPHTKYIPLVGFSSHNQQALTKVKENGIDETWLRATLQEELPAVLQRYLDPPIRYIDGWDEELPSLAAQGVETFNKGDYFEQHELLEDAWREEKRPIRELYQGILQIGVAFYQIELGNWAGAVKTFRRGLPKLRGLPPTCQGVQLAPFLATAERLHIEITELGPERLSAFDQGRFPQILLRSIQKNDVPHLSS